MLLFGIVCLLDVVLAVVITRMLVQAKRYRSLTPATAGPVRRDWPTIAVIVPARDEAASIGACVRGLLDQAYPAEQLRLIVVDDGSRDGTPDLARAAAAADPRFRIVSAAAPPVGWTGKTHALATGFDQLVVWGGRPDYLCFVDADTAAEPDLLRAAVAHARMQRIDMLSLGPAQVLGSWAERLVMPCGFFLIAASQDIARLNATERPEASANGQFLLFRTEAYCEIGGHAAVRAEICEDAALARRAKRHGLRFALLGADRLIRVRMYRDARALWSGLSKNVSALGGGPAGTVGIAAAGLALAIAVPVCAALTLAAWLHQPSIANALATGFSLAGFLALLGLHAAGARHFRIPFGYALLFPAGYAACLLLALNGARVVRYGGASWKGRRYPASRPSDTVAARPRSRGSAAERTHA